MVTVLGFAGEGGASSKGSKAGFAAPGLGGVLARHEEGDGDDTRAPCVGERGERGAAGWAGA